MLTVTNVQPEAAGSSYTLVASNALGTTTSGAMILNTIPLEVYIEIQNAPVLAGSTALLKATVNGQAPFDYQWRFNGTDLEGATSDTLSLTNVQASQAGLYSVMVSNSFGSASADYKMEVNLPVFDVGTTKLLMTTNGFQMELNNVFASESVVISASTNLADWVPILTNPPGSGTMQFLDADATNWPIRFYRATEQ